MAYKPAPKNQAVSQDTNNLVKLLGQYKPQIKDALPKHLNPDRIVRILMTEVRKNPDLAACTKESFFGAIFQCAQLGLEPGTGLGHAYLLPFKNKGVMECQLIIGYQGKIDLAERSGKVTIDAHAIYENDVFDFELGLNPSIMHKPAWVSDRGEVIGAYAVARYVDGRSKFRVISKEDIEKAREASKAGKSSYSPWATHYAEMALKTAVHRLFKLLPKSPDMATAQVLEEKHETGDSQELDNVFQAEVKEVPQEILEG